MAGLKSRSKCLLSDLALIRPLETGPYGTPRMLYSEGMLEGNTWWPPFPKCL